MIHITDVNTMSDDSIKLGDRVMLVWACCATARRRHIGWTGVVEHTAVNALTNCSYCDGITWGPTRCIELGDAQLSWLIKLPPEDRSKSEVKDEMLAV